MQVGATGKFTVKTTTGDGTVIDINTEVPSTSLVPAIIADARVEPRKVSGSILAGSIGEIDLIVRIAADIGRDGKIRVTLPPTYSFNTSLAQLPGTSVPVKSVQICRQCDSEASSENWPAQCNGNQCRAGTFIAPRTAPEVQLVYPNAMYAASDKSITVYGKNFGTDIDRIRIKIGSREFSGNRLSDLKNGQKIVVSLKCSSDAADA